MKIQKWNSQLIWFIMLLFGSCVEPYFPEVLESPTNYLVVNGFLNPNGRTTIQLFRTQNLNESSLPPVESNAVVRVESENGERYSLSESEAGNYVYDNMLLSQNVKYRLYIRTMSGKEYASDFVEVKVTPAIDSVHWKATGNELRVYVNTHDPNNDIQYYRWEFDQTWQFRVAFPANLIYENGAIRYRNQYDEKVDICWKTSFSNAIKLASSINSANDIIKDYHLFSIPAGTEPIGIRNSILIRQFALTHDAYQYWSILKKNTESIGTLFDPLPSQQMGNIHSLSDPEELVIGYLSAASVQEKRIFIDNKDLPNNWRPYFPTCVLDTLKLSDGNIHEYFKEGYQVPVSEIYPPNGGMNPIGYTYAPSSCVDCTVTGTNVRPAFWE